jgi:pantothenate kinase
VPSSQQICALLPGKLQQRTKFDVAVAGQVWVGREATAQALQESLKHFIPVPAKRKRQQQQV